MTSDQESFEELEIFLARERGRLRRFGIMLFSGGIFSFILGLVLVVIATRGAGGFLGSVGLSLTGIGLILTVRASFTLFTKKDEMVGLHLNKDKGEEES